MPGFPKMAWETTAEEAYDVILSHLREHPQVARDFCSKVEGSLLPKIRVGSWEYDDRWMTCLEGKVVIATVYDDDHFEKNLKVAMIKEMVGLGPAQYCVVDGDLDDFEDRLRYLLRFLPSHKVCLFPEHEFLEGPFSLPPWNTIGRLICNRPILVV